MFPFISLCTFKDNKNLYTWHEKDSSPQIVFMLENIMTKWHNLQMYKSQTSQETSHENSTDSNLYSEKKVTFYN